MRGFIKRRGDTWTAYWKIDRAQKTKGGFKTKGAAEAYLNKVMASIHQGTYVSPNGQTLAEVFDLWIVSASTRLRPATTDGYRRIFDRYVRGSIGKKGVQAVTPLDLDRLYGNLLAKPLSPTTVHHVHTLLHKVLSDAVKKDLVVRNVAQAASPPKPPTPAERRLSVWSPEEMARFLEFVEDDRLFALWRLYCVSGCRRGEALAATWEDIDLAAGRWEIKRAIGVINGKPILGLTKSGRARSVRLDAATVASLRAHRKAQLEERLAAGESYEDLGLVFSHHGGRALHPNVITHLFLRLAERAGLPRIRLHDVRHSAVTAMLRAGVDVKVVSERVGHASTTFTRDVYQSVLPDQQEDAADRMAAALDLSGRVRGG